MYVQPLGRLASWQTPTQAHPAAPAPLQEDFKKLQAQKVEERKQMEAKYAALFAPLFTQRAEIVANRLDPADVDTTQQEGAKNKVVLCIQRCAAVARVDTVCLLVTEVADPGDEEEEEEIGQGSNGVPGFWLQAMANNEVLAQVITERDAECLQFLTDIRCEYLDGMGVRHLLEASAVTPSTHLPAPHSHTHTHLLLSYRASR